MRPAVILLALLQLLAVAAFAVEYRLTARAPGGPSPAGSLLGLALAFVLPFAGPALWLAVRNRALPFALVLVLVLPAALAVAMLLR